jgi:hypothetical protein
MPKMTHAQVVARLKLAPSAIRCSEMKRMLGDLGFEVKDRAQGNHRTYSHPGLPNFSGGNYDCGHGADAQLLPCYIRDVRKVLEEFEAELRLREP